jgi:hypothetical protein
MPVGTQKKVDSEARRGHDRCMNTLLEPTCTPAMRQLLRLLAGEAPPSPGNADAWSGEAWDSIIELAARQGVSPLLYHCLAGAELPEAVRTRLRRHYLRTAADNTRRFAALEEALLALQHIDVPVILLKGGHLAPLVYGNIALRPMVDLDLLVNEEDASRALGVLSTLGYAPVKGEAWMSARLGHHGMRRADGLLLELHQRVGAFSVGTHVDQAGIWERAKPATVGKAPAMVLDAGDLLLHICVHSASQHLLQLGLMPLCDARQILVHYGAQIVPEEIVARAREWRVARAVFLTLSLSDTLLDAPVDPAMLDALCPSGAQDQLALATHILLHDCLQETAPSANVVAMWAEHSWRARLGVLVRVLLPGTERMRALYGVPAEQPVRPWLYLRRWADILTHRGRSMRQMMGRPDQDIDWQSLVQWLAQG